MNWPLRLAAALPCVVLLGFCGIGIHEWWLIVSHQAVVIPVPVPGQKWAEELPATSLLPFILGGAALAAVFAYAAIRLSKRALIWGYVALLIVASLPLIRHALPA
jgi:hypothetical protein